MSSSSRRLAAALALVALACTSPSGSEPSSTGEVAQAPAEVRASPPPTEPRVPAIEPAKPDVALAPEVEPIAAAVELFLASHPAPPTADEATLRADLDRLLGVIETALAGDRGQALLEVPGVLGAACQRSGSCSSDSPASASPESLAALDALEADGVRFLYAGEGTFEAVPNHRGLVARLDSRLTAAARAYLEAKGWQAERVDAAYDEAGFEGDLDDVTAAILRWDALADLGIEAYADAHEQARALTKNYLSLCWSFYTTPACIVEPDTSESYRRFIAEHPESRWRPAVECFTKRAATAKQRMNEKQHAAAVEACLAKVGGRTP